ncbi:threonylcarbamoyl-AMP synthase [Candidatus Dojkabacteria bacterium]|uniref:L-threonylcarbamoyladenylate synthase n=1 Tax=Candidatus Dojkabacteria bacterium TaxID=2099670 RepID=A0A3M0Z490_9BACT|nr:MAG: threonylcarbamoyl-AMP synthase [Candidatus Dojkabacteria bacterium]
MKIISLNENFEESLKLAIEVLNKGGLIIYPTETCYGAGVDATNSEAVSVLLDYKNRPAGKAISVAVSSRERAEDLIEIPKESEYIFEKFLPGPLTVVGKSKSKVDERLESEKKTLGIRISSNLFFLKLCQEYGKPITSTSANISGERTPYKIDHILNTLTDKKKSLIDVIFDSGELAKNPPSTVVDISTSELKVYRSGGINPKWHRILSVISKSVEDTIKFGESFFQQVGKFSDAKLILLSGDLGAGKTHFVKGLAKGLGIECTIKSPTYNYYNEFDLGNGGKFYHLDAWRIESTKEIELLGIRDWFVNKENVIAIEWPSVISTLDSTFFDSTPYFFIMITNLGPSAREIRVYLSN